MKTLIFPKSAAAQCASPQQFPKSGKEHQK